MVEINLAPETRFASAARRRRRGIFLLIGFIVFIALIIWGILFLVERSTSKELAAANEELKVRETEIARLGPEVARVDGFANRLAAVDALLTQHIKWSDLWLEIERLLPAPTVLSRITVNETNRSVEVSGAAPNMAAVAEAVASLVHEDGRQTLFHRGEITNVKRESKLDANNVETSASYTFLLKLSLLPN